MAKLAYSVYVEHRGRQRGQMTCRPSCWDTCSGAGIWCTFLLVIIVEDQEYENEDLKRQRVPCYGGVRGCLTRVVCNRGIYCLESSFDLRYDGHHCLESPFGLGHDDAHCVSPYGFI